MDHQSIIERAREAAAPSEPDHKPRRSYAGDPDWQLPKSKSAPEPTHEQRAVALMAHVDQLIDAKINEVIDAVGAESGCAEKALVQKYDSALDAMRDEMQRQIDSLAATVADLASRVEEIAGDSDAAAVDRNVGNITQIRSGRAA